MKIYTEAFMYYFGPNGMSTTTPIPFNNTPASPTAVLFYFDPEHGPKRLPSTLKPEVTEKEHEAEVAMPEVKADAQEEKLFTLSYLMNIVGKRLSEIVSLLTRQETSAALEEAAKEDGAIEVTQVERLPEYDLQSVPEISTLIIR